MKTGIFFTGTGPILVSTSCDSFSDSKIAEVAASKGIKKFIAYEIPESKVRDKYGMHFNVAMNDLHQSDEFRVVDEDGTHIMENFSLKDFENPTFYEH